MKQVRALWPGGGLIGFINQLRTLLEQIPGLEGPTFSSPSLHILHWSLWPNMNYTKNYFKWLFFKNCIYCIHLSIITIIYQTLKLRKNKAFTHSCLKQYTVEYLWGRPCAKNSSRRRENKMQSFSDWPCHSGPEPGGLNSIVMLWKGRHSGTVEFECVVQAWMEKKQKHDA